MPHLLTDCYDINRRFLMLALCFLSAYSAAPAKKAPAKAAPSPVGKELFPVRGADGTLLCPTPIATTTTPPHILQSRVQGRSSSASRRRRSRPPSNCSSAKARSFPECAEHSLASSHRMLCFQRSTWQGSLPRSLLACPLPVFCLDFCWLFHQKSQWLMTAICVASRHRTEAR